ncbi:DUF4265 domain-containing protein [Cronobacter dublinensis]
MLMFGKAGSVSMEAYLTSKSEFIKVTFRLIQDEDGYPPVSYESVWLKRNGNGEYELDNIPLYIYGVSKGDVITFQKSNDEYVVGGIAKRKGHSTLRIYINEAQQKESVISALQSLGGHIGTSASAALFSLDIPSDIPFLRIDAFLKSKYDDGILDYEDACLQHSDIDPIRVSECESVFNIACTTP